MSSCGKGKRNFIVKKKQGSGYVYKPKCRKIRTPNTAASKLKPGVTRQGRFNKKTFKVIKKWVPVTMKSVPLPTATQRWDKRVVKVFPKKPSRKGSTKKASPIKKIRRSTRTKKPTYKLGESFIN